MVIISEEKLAEIATKTLWRPQLEKDECGVGFVTSIKGVSTHKVNFGILQISGTTLRNHRLKNYKYHKNIFDDIHIKGYIITSNFHCAIFYNS